MFADIPTKEFIKNAIFQTLKANNFFTDAHIRLTLNTWRKNYFRHGPSFKSKRKLLNCFS